MRNGTGGYSLPANSWSPAVNGASATSADWNATAADIASAIQQSISADGQTPITGDLQMGGNKLTGLADGSGTGQSLRFEQLFSQGALTDIASAATTDIGGVFSNFLRVTGSTTITSFGANYNGPKFLIFAGSVLLTNSATLVLPGGANITTSANDALIAIPISGGWQVVSFQFAANNTTDSLKNLIINGGFPINQRGVSGTVTLSAGQYGHDRWKAGAAGCTYTFATVNNVTTITITSGSLQQVILGTSLYSGTHVLSWTGTAQGKIGAGSYSASGVTGSVTGGTNTTVEFGTGTLSNVQFEMGVTPTAFSSHGPLELSMCQFYGEPCPDMDMGGYATSGASFNYRFNFLTPKRTAPTGAGIAFSSVNLTSCAATATSSTSVKITAVVTATGVFAFNNTSAPFFSCEL